MNTFTELRGRLGWRAAILVPLAVVTAIVVAGIVDLLGIESSAAKTAIGGVFLALFVLFGLRWGFADFAFENVDGVRPNKAAVLANVEQDWYPFVHALHRDDVGLVRDQPGFGMAGGALIAYASLSQELSQGVDPVLGGHRETVIVSLQETFSES